MSALSKVVLHEEHLILLVLTGCTVYVLQIGHRCPLAMFISVIRSPSARLSRARSNDSTPPNGKQTAELHVWRTLVLMVHGS